MFALTSGTIVSIFLPLPPPSPPHMSSMLSNVHKDIFLTCDSLLIAFWFSCDWYFCNFFSNRNQSHQQAMCVVFAISGIFQVIAAQPKKLAPKCSIWFLWRRYSYNLQCANSIWLDGAVIAWCDVIDGGGWWTGNIVSQSFNQSIHSTNTSTSTRIITSVSLLRSATASFFLLILHPITRCDSHARVVIVRHRPTGTSVTRLTHTQSDQSLYLFSYIDYLFILLLCDYSDYSLIRTHCLNHLCPYFCLSSLFLSHSLLINLLANKLAIRGITVKFDISVTLTIFDLESECKWLQKFVLELLSES